MKNFIPKTLTARIFTAACLVLLLLPAAYADTVNLTGQTRLPQLPDAAVTIWIGDQSTAVAADENGRFSAVLEVSPGPELVRVEACGVSEQAGICYARLIHTAAEIAARAGTDQTYMTGDLSPVSTAAWGVLVRALPDGTIPTVQADIEQYRRSFDPGEIKLGAPVLALLARGAGPLPAGANDLIDLALDPALLAEARNSLDPDDIATQLEAIVQNDTLMKIPDDDFALAQTGYFVNLSNSDSSSGSAFEITLDGAGDGFYAELFGSGSVEWANVHAGELIFADDMEAVGTGTRYVSLAAPDRDSIIPPLGPSFFIPPGENESVEVETLLEEVRWREVDVSEMLRLAVLRQVQNRVVPDRPDLDPDEIDNLGVRFNDQYAISRSEGASLSPSPVPVAGSQWAFARCDTDCRSEAGVVYGANLDLIAFNADGTATSEIVDPGLSWSQSGQRTIIEQNDGTTVEVVPFGSTAMHIGDLETTRVVARATRADGQTLMTAQLAIEADPGFEFSADTLPGRYESMSPFGGVFVLEPDGTGWQAFLDDPAAPRPDSGGFDVEWSIEATGDLLLLVKLRGSNTVVAWWPLRPARETAAGFYAIQRLAFSGPVIESGGTLIFWREVQ